MRPQDALYGQYCTIFIFKSTLTPIIEELIKYTYRITGKSAAAHFL